MAKEIAQHLETKRDTMRTTENELNIDPKEQASLQANFMSLAVASGYIDDGSPLYISHLRVIEETAQYCHNLLGRTDELLDSPEAALQKAFGLGAYPTTAEVENLMDSLKRTRT